MRELTYLDFDLLVERGSGEHSYRARVVNAPSGQTSPVEFTVPFSDLELENFLLKIGHPRRQSVRGLGSTESETIRQFGARLFDAVFRDDVRVTLATSLDQAESNGAGLRLRLRLGDVPELGDIPWEYLYDKGNRRFPALSQWTPVVRYLDLPGRIRPLTVTPPLNVLVIVAGPTDFPPLNVDAEWEKLRTALRGLERLGRVQMDRTDTGTLAALQRKLRRGQYHVLHYIGHGGFDAQAEDGVLAFEGPQGRAQLVTGHDLGGRLHDHRTLRLAVLNACEGARGGRIDPYSGTAQSLVRQGVPAVVAMQFEITDDAAITFSQALYEAVADGYPLDAAMAEGRKAIHDQPNPIEWATPVLYLRAPDAQIFDLTSEPADSKETSPPKETTDGDTRGSTVDTTGDELHDDHEFSGALAAIAAQRWDEAVYLLGRVQARYPTDQRVSERLGEAVRQRDIALLDGEARETAEHGDWTAAVTALEHLAALQPHYGDVQERLIQARTRQRVAELQSQVRRFYATQQWTDVVRVGEQISAIDASAGDPDGVVTKAKTELANLERAKLAVPASRRRYGKPLLAGALLLAAAIIGVWLVASGPDDQSAEPQATPTPETTTPPPPPPPPTYAESRKIETTVEDPADLEVAEGALVIAFGSGVVQRIDPATGQETHPPIAFGYDGGNDLLWNPTTAELAVTLQGGSRVGFLDSAFGNQQAVRVAGARPLNGAVSPDGFWFACHVDGSGVLVHMTSRTQVQRIPVDYTPYGLVVDGDYVYVTFAEDDLVGRVHTTTGAVETAPVGDLPVDIALINGALWVTLGNDDQVAVVDPQTLQVRDRFPVGDEPWKLAYGLDSVWVTNRTAGNQGSVTRLDPETGQQQQEPIPVGRGPDELAVGGQEIYVGNRGDSSISVLVAT